MNTSLSIILLVEYIYTVLNSENFYPGAISVAPEHCGVPGKDCIFLPLKTHSNLLGEHLAGGCTLPCYPLISKLYIYISVFDRRQRT